MSQCYSSLQLEYFTYFETKKYFRMNTIHLLKGLASYITYIYIYTVYIYMHSCISKFHGTLILKKWQKQVQIAIRGSIYNNVLMTAYQIKGSFLALD